MWCQLCRCLQVQHSLSESWSKLSSSLESKLSKHEKRGTGDEASSLPSISVIMLEYL